MREASGELLRCQEEKGLLVEEEVLIVDCGSLKMKGIPWKGAILMEDDGGSWKRNCGRLQCTGYGYRLEAPAAWSVRVKLTVYESRIP